MLDLRGYIKHRLAEQGVSEREVARGVGVTPTYFSRVMTGKARPSVRFCLKLAECLGESPLRVLSLAGYLPPGDDTLAREIAEQIAADPLLAELLRTYLKIGPGWLKEMFVRMAQAALSVAGKD